MISTGTKQPSGAGEGGYTYLKGRRMQTSGEGDEMRRYGRKQNSYEKKYQDFQGMVRAGGR
jgi:hypothetical protein